MQTLTSDTLHGPKAAQNPHFTHAYQRSQSEKNQPMLLFENRALTGLVCLVPVSLSRSDYHVCIPNTKIKLYKLHATVHSAVKAILRCSCFCEADRTQKTAG